MRYKVIYENGKWIVTDTYRNKDIDSYQSEETAKRMATLFENISLLARRDDDLK